MTAASFTAINGALPGLPVNRDVAHSADSCVAQHAGRLLWAVEASAILRRDEVPAHGRFAMEVPRFLQIGIRGTCFDGHVDGVDHGDAGRFGTPWPTPQIVSLRTR